MHVVEVSQSSASVRIADGCLSIATGDQLLGRVPISEVSALLLSSPHTMCSVTALAALAACGTPVIVCDQAMRPAGMMLPYREHHQIATRITAQAAASLPLRKRLWMAIIRSKIAGQASILTEVIGNDHGLSRTVKRVRSGDPTNVEGQAARRYWRRLFGQSLRRRRGEGLTNKMLDYSYAVLRAAVTRSICVAGLHPSLGIHHHNRSNAFALADDLIEPFRPVIDRLVVDCGIEYGGADDLTPPIKRRLAGCLQGKVTMGNEWRSVQDSLGRCTSSLAGVFLGEREAISLPWIG